MKNIENPDIWKLCTDVLDDTDLSDTPFAGESCDLQNKTEKDNVRKNLQKELSRIAQYTYERDVKTGRISQLKLSQMEEHGEIIGSHIFCRMARHYYFLEQITGKDCSKKRKLCATLYANLGNVFFFPPKREVMEKVAAFGIRMLEVEDYDFRTTDYSNGIVSAIRILQGYGFQLHMAYGSVDCGEKLNHEIFKLLERKVKTAGGLALLMYLGKTYFFDQYIPVLDRYMLSRSVDNRQSVPIQLLLSLAIKHLSINDKNYDKKDRQCSEMVELAQAWYNIWDVEGETGMEYAMGTVEQYPLKLFNQIMVDKFCIPKQYNRKYILSSLDHLIQPLFFLGERKYSYDDYRKATCYLMDLPCFIGVLDVNRMKQQLDVAKYKIDLILEDMSISAIQVNAGFTGIDTACDHYKWPLIKYPLNQYVYIDYHICGFGFYHAIYEIIKKHDGAIDKKQGIYVENMLKDELEKKEYRYSSGKYAELKHKNLKGSECDLVMQDKHTLFFEVKKTPIADELENLDDVTMLQQLAKGIVKAQKQCFLHELYLKENGSICLEEDGVENIINPTGAKDNCFKISVCHQEYSFLTSKNFCTLLLETILLGGFGVKDPERKDDLNQLNHLGNQIWDTVSRINAQGDVVARDAVFCSAFCSLQQVLTALWNSEDEEDFLYMIKEWIYCQDKSLDPYIQILTHIYHRQNPEEPDLKKSIIEMFEKTGRKSLYIG